MTHPHDRHNGGLKAREPDIGRGGGGAGFAVQVGALQFLLCPGGAAGACHLLQQLACQVGVALGHHTFGVVKRCGRGCFEQDMALGVGDPFDHHRCNRVTAIGQRCIGRGHLHRGGAACAQAQAEVVRLAVQVKTETGQPLPRRAHAHMLQQPQSHQVFGLGQCTSNGDGAIKLAVSITRVPCVRVVCGEVGQVFQWGVVHQGVGHDAFFKGRRVNERFDRGARLPPSLGGVVEGLTRKIKTAHQGTYMASLRVQGHKGGLCLWPLRHGPGIAGALQNTDDSAAAQCNFAGRVGCQSCLNPA